MRNIILAVFFLFSGMLTAQQADGIIAIIGEDIILKSELENQYIYYLENGQKDDGTLKCQILEDLIVNKLLLSKAKQDSLVVSEAQVEQDMERRIAYFIQVMGGLEQLEEYYGKSLIEIKVDLRPEIRDQLLMEQQRDAIKSGIKITPKEVQDFYHSIPEDSLPYMPAEVQLHHIVKQPGFNPESEKAVIQRILEIRKQVLDGEMDFCTAARKYSKEPGVSKSCGDLGWFGRGQMVPEFEDIVFDMTVGTISPPVKTMYGLHIIYLQEREGERVHASHILLTPEKTEKEVQQAQDSLILIRKLIEQDTLTFEEAAIQFSDDVGSRSCGGCVMNPQTGELKIPLDLLDADLYFKVEDLKEGEISQPLKLLKPNGETAYHMIYLKKKIPPHKLNLKDDYQKIKQAALESKQAEAFEKWIEQAKKNIYIDIKDKNCQDVLDYWMPEQ